jgi:hypothetical protein
MPELGIPYRLDKPTVEHYPPVNNVVNQAALSHPYSPLFHFKPYNQSHFLNGHTFLTSCTFEYFNFGTVPADVKSPRSASALATLIPVFVLCSPKGIESAFSKLFSLINIWSNSSSSSSPSAIAISIPSFLSAEIRCASTSPL